MATSYKALTSSEVEEKMLNNMSGDYSKTVGSFAYDLTKTYAIESAENRELIKDLYYKLDVNYISGDELTKYVLQRKGTVRKSASKASGEVTVTGTGDIVIGDLFETEAGTQFVSTEDITIVDSGIVNVEAVEAGLNGDVSANTIIYIPVTIQGITEVTNENSTNGGYDEETDISLIERYLLALQKPATSGNRYHYMEWAREIIGVGDTKVISLWNGDNTVKVIIIDDEKLAASTELIAEVQEYIDPKGTDNSTWGAGYGEAPIGAYCTVVSATKLDININATITLKDGYELTTVTGAIELAIKNYLKSIAFKKDYVSYALVSSWMINVDGVEDWTSFTMNGDIQNVQIGDEEVAQLGTVVIGV